MKRSVQLASVTFLVASTLVAVSTMSSMTSVRALGIDSSLTAPTNVCPTSKNGSVELKWDLVLDSRITGAMVQYRAVGSATWLNGPSVSGTTNTIDVPGVNGTQYEYRVAAEGATGRSDWGGRCLMAWGDNESGQLGTGSTQNSTSPVWASDGALTGRSVTSISAGGDHTCAVLDNGTAACWGLNNVGQLGNGSYVNSSSPVLVSGDPLTGRSVTSISTGGYHTCAVLDNGSIVCWGFNDRGQLGNGSTTISPLPVLVSGGALAGRSVTSISAGGSHTCAILDNGAAACWGNNDHGQLGNGTTTNSSTPVLVSGGALADRSVTSISAGGSHTCAVLDNGSIACWGSNLYNQAGSGSMTDSLSPALVFPALSGRSASAISTGSAHSCALFDNGTMACWGQTVWGQTGDGYSGYSSLPVFISGGALSGHTVTSVSAGRLHTCAVIETGTTVCWGQNLYGQLGNGSKTNSWLTTTSCLPVAVHASNYDLLASGGRFSVARWAGIASPGQPASSPFGVTATPDIGEDVSLTWSAPGVSGAAPVSEYQVELSSDTGRTWTVGVSVAGATTSTTVSVPRDNYWMFRVRAVTSDDIAPSDWATSNEVLIVTDTRTTTSNVSVTFVTPDDSPLVGSTVSWQTTDGALKSGSALTTDLKGKVVSPLIATGPVTFTLSGGSVGTSATLVSSATFTTVIARGETAVTITSPPTPTLATRTIDVEMPDGTRVPDTGLTISGGLAGFTRTGVTSAERSFSVVWQFAGWTSRHSSGVTGSLALKGFDVPSVGADITAHFSDDLIDQTAWAPLTSELATVRLEQIPVVRVITPDPTDIELGAPASVTVEAVDGTGNPVTGVDIALSQIETTGVSSTSLSSEQIRARSTGCSDQLSRTTDSRGRAIFTLCPTSASQWRADGANLVPSRPISVTVKFPKAVTLSVSKSGPGSGSVTSSTGGVSCGSNCTSDIDYNTSVTLTATPATGSTFTGWSGACTGIGTCTVSMIQTRTVTASFALAAYRLSVTTLGTGSGMVRSTPVGVNCGSSCTQSFDYNTTVDLIATAATGSTFTGWSGACSGIGSWCTISMTETRTVTATFALTTYRLAVAKSGTGSGSVQSSSAGVTCGPTCGRSFGYNVKVILTAKPASNSIFTGWSGACTGKGTCVVTMTKARNVTAIFKKKKKKKK